MQITVLLSKHRKLRKLKLVNKKVNRVSIDLILYYCSSRYCKIRSDNWKKARMSEPVWIWSCFLPSLTEFATSKIMNIIQSNLAYLNINSTKVVGLIWFDIMYDHSVHCVQLVSFVCITCIFNELMHDWWYECVVCVWVCFALEMGLCFVLRFLLEPFHIYLQDICICIDIMQRKRWYLFTEMPSIWKFTQLLSKSLFSS